MTSTNTYTSRLNYQQLFFHAKDMTKTSAVIKRPQRNCQFLQNSNLINSIQIAVLLAIKLAWKIFTVKVTSK